MKAPSPSQPPRTFALSARFAPDTPDFPGRINFSAFWLAAYNQIIRLGHKRYLRKKSQFAKLKAAKRKTDPIIFEALGGRISLEEAAKKVGRLVPDKAIAKKILDVWHKAIRETPEGLAIRKLDITRQEKELAQSTRLLEAKSAIVSGLATLVKAAEAGDAEASKMLLETAIEASVQVYFAEKKYPERFAQAAKGQAMWPILAEDDPGWEKAAARRIADLGLGENLRALKTRFRTARGADVNLPARIWAKAAVRTIEESRLRALMFGKLLRDFGSADAMAEFCMAEGWRYAEDPGWMAHAARLAPFSRTCVAEWKAVIRKLIREELPDLQNRPEWAAQRNSASARGRDTPGEIQNAILDDITSALERIAPVPEC